MKKFEITAVRANGSQFTDVVYAANESAARRDFAEIYRHCDGRKIIKIVEKEA